jgi:uncharacterized integral membrane protein
MSGPPDATPPPPPPPPPTGTAGKEPAFGLTRAGALWTTLSIGFLILIVLLIFIAQNTGSVRFTFFGWHWSLPLGVAILASAVVGGLITVAAGTARILQLRRAGKRQHAAATRPI